MRVHRVILALSVGLLVAAPLVAAVAEADTTTVPTGMDLDNSPQ